MKLLKLSLNLIILVVVMTGTLIASDFLDQFEDEYKALDAEILSYQSTKVDVTDLIYQKDRATFTFKSGTFYLIRHLNDRPTAAIFIGEGHCALDPEVPNERSTLEWCSNSPTIDESFESCFIRFADDLDLKLADFPSETFKITWKEYNTYKQAQAEYYFRPVTFHEYDNYFQLLRSVYERNEDGFFWIDFNRYVIKYDPALPEPMVVAYEHEGGEFSITEAASLAKMGTREQTNFALSTQQFPTTCVGRSGSLRLTGMTGQNIDEASITMDLMINRDSLKFISTFLHYNLDIDSILYKGRRCDYYRRGEFTFVGVILPEYLHQGETASLTYFYHGKDYTASLPFVKDPTPSTIQLDLYGSTDFDYFLPGKGPRENAQGRFDHWTIAPKDPYRHFYFQAVSNSFDTLTKITSSGIELNFLKSDRYAKDKAAYFVPDDKYEDAIFGAFDFYLPRLGELPTSEPIFVYPDSMLSMPGLVELKQLTNYEDQTGDLIIQAGNQAGRQWFGSLARPASDRELWVNNGFADYLGLRYGLEAADARAFWSQLVLRQHMIERAEETNRLMPPGSGDRASVEIRTAKGSWIVHMLRYLMYDPQRPSEIDFLKFLRETAQRVNDSTFTNADIKAIAEKYYGEPLDWFFDQWLFDRYIPKYEGSWSVAPTDAGYMVTIDLNTSNVSDKYTMPVWVRVAVLDGNLYKKITTHAGTDKITIGPFEQEPSDLVFNEFLSTLCHESVSKK